MSDENNVCLYDKNRKCQLYKNPQRIPDVWQFCIPCQLNRLNKKLDLIIDAIDKIEK